VIGGYVQSGWLFINSLALFETALKRFESKGKHKNINRQGWLKKSYLERRTFLPKEENWSHTRLFFYLCNSIGNRQKKV